MYEMPLSTAHWFLDLHLNIQQHNNIISTVINQLLISINVVACFLRSILFLSDDIPYDTYYDTYSISEFH